MLNRWAIFISGTGSNMMALLEKRHLINVVCVVTSNPEALGAYRARLQGVFVKVFKKEDSWEKLSDELCEIGVTRIFLAGFMRILPETFIKEWGEGIYNIHPSLLPQYPGLKSIEKAFLEGNNTGVTIHKVDKGIDSGEILLQKQVTRQESLEKTEFIVHVNEHNLIRQFANASGITSD